MQQYAEWNIQVYEQEFVIPGLVDLAVRCNGDWGNSENASRAGVSGGITFFLEEPSIYGLSSPDGNLYCDVGSCHQLKGIDSMAEMSSLDSSIPFAVKAYMTSPSSFCAGVKEHLSQIIEKSGSLPLIIDSFCPSDSSIRFNSPFRQSSLKDRVTEPLSSRLSHGDAYSNDVTPCVADDDPSSVVLSSSGMKRRRTSCSAVIDEMFRYRKLKGNQDSYEVLSRISLLGYANCGTTSFQETIGSRKASVSLEDRSPPVTPTALKARRRPSAISVEPTRSLEREEYVVYYGQYPEEMEETGVQVLISALHSLKNPSVVNVHVSNLCSASAICTLLDYKTDFPGELTLGTAPHYLYYTKENIQTGNTRFKVCPPIRCANNQKFLWKVLRAEGLDAVSSNHVSVSMDFKFLNSGSFKRAVSGVSGLGFGLRAVWTKSRDVRGENTESPEQDLIRLVRLMSSQPASILHISHKRGAIRKGNFADFVVWNPFAPCSITPSYCKHADVCPFTSELLMGKVQKVFVRGRLAFCDGEFHPVGRKETRRMYQL